MTNAMASGQSRRTHTPIGTNSTAPYASSGDSNIERDDGDLVDHNFKDTITVQHDAWMEHYAPFRVTDEDIQRCMAELVKLQIVIASMNGDKTSYVWCHQVVPRKPSEGRLPDSNQAFETFQRIYRAVTQADIRPEGRTQNTLEYLNGPDHRLVSSDGRGLNRRIYGSLVGTAHIHHRPIPVSDVVIPGEFEVKRTVEESKQIRTKILSDSHFSLSDDPRRVCVYAFTVEDERFSLWYFSRSHSAKSMSFDWIKQPELLVRAFLFFAYATEAELGIDPLVHRFSEEPRYMKQRTAGSGDGNWKETKAGERMNVEELVSAEMTMNIQEQDGGEVQMDAEELVKGKVVLVESNDQVESIGNNELSTNLGHYYVYEFPPQENTDQKTRYFRTTRLIFEKQSMRIAGHHTRVWEVVEVAGLEPEHHQDPKRFVNGPYALKEACLDIGAPTEVKNQAHLFRDIEAFIATDYTNDPRLKDFTPEMKENLNRLFLSGEYKSLFLTALFEAQGLSTKTACIGSWPSPEAYNPRRPTTVKAGSTTRTTSSNRDTGEYVPGGRRAGGAELEATNDRKYTPKRQSRFVYEEVCTSLYDVTTFGEVMRTLDQTLVALQVMFCAGWVHRDISPGNILVCKGKGKVEVKLADLEYAKPYPDDKRKVTWDPKTGTPDFMPYEMLAGKFLAEEERRQVPLNRDPTGDDGEIDRRKLLANFFKVEVDGFPKDADIVIPSHGEHPIHSFQHDIESMWLCALWFIARCAGHAASIAWACRMFSGELDPTVARRETLTMSLTLPKSPWSDNVLPELKPLLEPLDQLRIHLYVQYTYRVFTNGLCVPGSYSYIHAEASRAFKRIVEDGGDWERLLLSPVDTVQPPQFQLKRPTDDSEIVRDPSPTPIDSAAGTAPRKKQRRN